MSNVAKNATAKKLKEPAPPPPSTTSKRSTKLKAPEPAKLAHRCVCCKQICLVRLHRCPKCGTFNSLNELCLASEQIVTSEASVEVGDKAKKDKEKKDLLVPLGQIDPIDPPRIPSGDQGLDHVLGGGVVLGSVVLLFGSPGAGKSTLATMVACSIANHFTVYYAIGEHGKERVRRMTDRMKVNKLAPMSAKNLIVLDEASKDTDRLCGFLKNEKPTPVLCVVDSFMSIASENSTGQPGSPSQVKYAALKFRSIAEDTGMAVIGIAHVTNDGSLAGPSHSKHFVDTLLMLEHVKFENDKTFKVIPKRIPGKPSYLRLAAHNKNRDGDVSACAYYKMTKLGLHLIGLEDEDGIEWSEDPDELGSSTKSRKSRKSGESDDKKASATDRKRARKTHRRKSA